MADFNDINGTAQNGAFNGGEGNGAFTGATPETGAASASGSQPTQGFTSPVQQPAPGSFEAPRQETPAEAPAPEAQPAFTPAEAAQSQPAPNPQPSTASQPNPQPQPQPQPQPTFGSAPFNPNPNPISQPGFAPGTQAYGAQPPRQPQPGAYGMPPHQPNQPGVQQPPQGAPFAGGAYGGNEYRYTPPFGAVPPQPPVKKPREKKKKTGRSFSSGAIALIVCACVLLSFGAGFGGAALAFGTGTTEAATGDDQLVVYKSVQLTDEDGDELSDDLTVSDVCSIVSNSVVEITTEFMSSYGNYQYVQSGAGSGVIVSEDGYIITNNHVIADTENNNTAADTITVRLTDGTEYKAKLIGTDSDSDIALLKIEAEGLTYAVQGDSSSLTVGSQVVAVGNPLGKLGGTITSGIISSSNREITVDGNKMNLIQIDAAINPGNSGGGLFNMKGELIGIVNAKSTGTGIEGLGFAIPVNDAYDVMKELKTNGYVTGKTYIGVSLYDITDEFTAYRYFGSQATGVYVVQVVEGYNDSVIKYGDRIVAIDGDEVTSSDDVKSIISEHKVGDELKVSVYREGKLIDITVTLFEYVPDNGVSFSQDETTK